MSAETFIHFVTTRCDGRTDRQTDGRLDDRLEDACIECSAVKTANVSATAVKHELEAVYAAIGSSCTRRTARSNVQGHQTRRDSSRQVRINND